MSRALLSLFFVTLALNSGALRAEGLINRLPADGSRVKYDLHTIAEMEAHEPELAELGIPKTFDVRGSITLGAVERVRIDNRECRWIEIGREIAELEVPERKVKSILKLLIPEKNFERGEDPLSHVLRMENWNPGGMVKAPEPIVDSARKRYEIERFRNLIPERLHDVKPLGARIIQTPLGLIECEGREGVAELAPSPLFPGTGGEWAWKATIEVWGNDEFPFGVVSLRSHSTGYETVGSTEKKLRFKSATTLTISAVGDEALISQTDPSPSDPSETIQANVKGRVTDPTGKPIPDVRVLFQIPGSNKNMAMVTAADGTYEGKAPVGSITIRVTHRTVDSNGKAKAVILLIKRVEIPDVGKTFDLVTQKAIPK